MQVSHGGRVSPNRSHVIFSKVRAGMSRSASLPCVGGSEGVDILPAFQPSNPSDGGHRDSIPCRCHVLSFVGLTDGQDIGLRQPSVGIPGAPAITDEAILECMADIVFVQQPLQVGRDIVPRVPITMVDLMERRRLGIKEGRRDEQMDTLAFAAPGVSPQADAPVARFPREALGFQDSTDVRTGAGFDPAHAAEVRDLVPAFIADDGAPLFVEQGGTMTLHQDLPPGITSPAVTSSAGTSCVNFTTTDTSAPSRWTCDDCGEAVVSTSKAWVDNARATHRCPTPERVKVAARITMALQGAYDG